jgi:hypothetical protein
MQTLPPPLKQDLLHVKWTMQLTMSTTLGMLLLLIFDTHFLHLRTFSQNWNRLLSPAPRQTPRCHPQRI